MSGIQQTVHTWGETKNDVVVQPPVLAHATKRRDTDHGNKMLFILEFQVEIKVITLHMSGIECHVNTQK